MEFLRALRSRALFVRRWKRILLYEYVLYLAETHLRMRRSSCDHKNVLLELCHIDLYSEENRKHFLNDANISVFILEWKFIQEHSGK